MKLRTLQVFLLLPAAVLAAEKLPITVTHNPHATRPPETIVGPWAEVNKVPPGTLLQRIAVKDTAGRVLLEHVRRRHRHVRSRV